LKFALQSFLGQLLNPAPDCYDLGYIILIGTTLIVLVITPFFCGGGNPMCSEKYSDEAQQAVSGNDTKRKLRNFQADWHINPKNNENQKLRTIPGASQVVIFEN
jgi:hypothetical protein